MNTHKVTQKWTVEACKKKWKELMRQEQQNPNIKPSPHQYTPSAASSVSNGSSTELDESGEQYEQNGYFQEEDGATFQPYTSS